MFLSCINSLIQKRLFSFSPVLNKRKKRDYGYLKGSYIYEEGDEEICSRENGEVKEIGKGEKEKGRKAER